MAQTQLAARGIETYDFGQTFEKNLPLLTDPSSEMRISHMALLIGQHPAVMIAGYRIDMSASQCPPAFFNAAAPICDISGAYHRIHRLLLQPAQCLLQASVFAVNVPYNADFLNHLVPRRFPYLVRTPCRLVSERGVNYPSATNPFQPFIYSINVSLSPS